MGIMPASGYLGVYETNRRGWFQVKIMINARRYSFGVHRDAERQARIHDAIVKRLRPGAEMNFDGELPAEMCLADLNTLLRKRGLE